MYKTDLDQVWLQDMKHLKLTLGVRTIKPRVANLFVMFSVEFVIYTFTKIGP